MAEVDPARVKALGAQLEELLAARAVSTNVDARGRSARRMVARKIARYRWRTIRRRMRRRARV